MCGKYSFNYLRKSEQSKSITVNRNCFKCLFSCLCSIKKIVLYSHLNERLCDLNGNNSIKINLLFGHLEVKFKGVVLSEHKANRVEIPGKVIYKHDDQLLFVFKINGQRPY